MMEERQAGDATQQGPSAGSESPGASRGPQEAQVEAISLGALPAEDLLLWFLGVLAEKAWQGMGLLPLPSTGKLEKDLGAARIAIDAYGALVEVLRPKLENARRREIESVLTTLRLNYVEKASPG